MNDRIGTTLRGYHIRGRISTGGFSVVYRAFQPGVEREVAIKVIHPMLANEPNFIRRFETEAQLIERLEHPFIVPIFDFWRDPDGAYLVMRWFPDNLRNLLNRRGKLEPELALRVVDQVASALAFAHRQQVVHLDIKPDNILLDADGNAFLSDFGIARMSDESLLSDREDDDETVGSPAYMSPEQLIGGAITPATDIYQFGVTIYEMLRGAHPYPRSEASTLILNQLRDPLPPLPNATAKANPILARATLKDPTTRYESALTLATELRRALLGDLSPAMILGDLPADATISLNPYKGLRAFEEADSDDFFGREALTETLMARLMDTDAAFSNFLAVVGPSGSGKSSVVRAGLIPALRRNDQTRDWFIVDLLPGTHPLDGLAAALLSVARAPIPDLAAQLTRDPGALVDMVNVLLPLLVESGGDGDLLLFIDQFEEVYTLVEDAAERAQFLALLEAAVRAPGSRLHLVIALRADFYDRPLSDPRFGTLMQARTQVVLPLNSSEIETAIVRPATRVGLNVERELVTAMVADVREEPGALPLLQYALTELYERRADSLTLARTDGTPGTNGDQPHPATENTPRRVERRLTLATYRAMGGLMGAVARRAEEVYADLPPDAQTVARQIMLRLVTLGEGVEDTRRRVKRAELAALSSLLSGRSADETIGLIVERFGRARLLTFDHDADTREPTVEIAHEALIRAWTRLRDWLNVGRGEVRLQRALASLAAEWEQNGRDAGFLLLGARLTQFDEWANAKKPNPFIALTASESAFLTASIGARVGRDEAEGVRRSRELELARGAADAERRRAEQLRAFVRAMTLVGAALLFVTGLAAFFALQSIGNAAESDRRAKIAQAIALAAQADVELRGMHPERAALLALTALDDYPYTLQAERALTNAVLSNRLVRVWDGMAAVNAVAFSQDGRRAAAATSNGQVAIWAVDTGALVTQIESPTDTLVDDNGLTAIEFHPNDAIVLTAAQDGGVRLWDVETGVLLWEGLHRGIVAGATFSADGGRILSVSTDGNLRIWAVSITHSDGLEVSVSLMLDVNDERLRNASAIAASPTGGQLATTADDAIHLWDMTTGDQRLTLRRIGGEINSVAFSPDGRLMVSANADNTLTIWRIGSLDPNSQLTLTGHTAPPTRAAYSVDGTRIVSTGSDNTVRVWDAITGALLYTLAGHDGAVSGAVFNADGSAILSGSADGTARLWSASTALEGRAFAGHTQLVNAVAFSPDGTRAATGGYDRIVRVWDVQTGVELLTLRQGDWINAVVYSPDGARIISGGRDGIVYVWDAGTGAQVMVYEQHTGIIDAIAISPDGRWIASGGSDRVVRVWDAMTGATRLVFSAHTAGVNGLAFSPDGNEIVSAAFDSTARLWDAATGAIRLTLSGHDGGVTSVDFSATGNLIVTGGADHSVRVWDAATGAAVTSFLGHTDLVYAVKFSPNGRRILSASEDTALRVWDVPSHQPVIAYGTVAQPIRDATFNPTGTAILVGYRDGSVRLWRTWQDAATLAADARTCCVYRALTAAEQQLFGLGG
ncbi:MAG: protein kinase [Chloroflexota bacterium]|nr:protein kinase [Chloroflexota bacterium]